MTFDREDILMKNERLVVVETFHSEIDAQISKAHLKSNGIASLIVKDDLAGMFPNFQYTEGVALLVLERDLHKAEVALSVRKK
jgi:hypothetical protein